ncbi:MAG: virulence RhuM family protein [Bacteroidales bacterium]|nr:virulence RhuM family protein [Bacteroidales bacterium]
MEEELVFYEPNANTRLEVRLFKETVWLTQEQIGTLFNRERSGISRHLNNIFNEGELDKESNVSFFHIANSDKPIGAYNLDVILAVGYRVKSMAGIYFRRWASSVLKDYLLRGYSVNQRIDRLEQRVVSAEKKIDFFVRTSLPPTEGIFYDGQIFDAFVFVSDLIKRAKSRITLIDNYIDETVLVMLDKRAPGVSATIYTDKISDTLQLDITKHNSQYAAITVLPFHQSHDRFLIIDNDVYHIGASLKDLGKKWFAFSKLYDISINDVLNKLPHTRMIQ